MTNYTPKTFLDAIKPFALSIQLEHNIPWLMTATQAAHESRNGNSMLTHEANNLFGITGDSWEKEGKPVYVIETREYHAGAREPYSVRRPFRKYASWKESLDDWASLILRLYPKAYQKALAGDAQGFFDGLKAGGYATDPQYAELLGVRYSELEAIA